MRRLLLFCLAALSVAWANTQDAPLGIRVLDGADRTAIVAHGTRGDTITRRIEVENEGDAPVTVQLFAGAAKVSAGKFEPDDRSNDLVAWTKLEPAELTIGPGSTGQGTVSITIPRDASAAERYAFVWASAGSTRVGVRLTLSVGPGTAPASDFMITSVEARRTDAGAPVVVVRVHNTQHRAIDVSAELHLVNGPGGRTAGPFHSDPGVTVGIDQGASLLVPVDRSVPNGPWDAQLLVRAGAIVHETAVQLTFPEKPGSSAPPIKTTIPRGSGAGFVVLVLVLLVVAAGALVIARRHRSRAQPG